jgi:hypothetical protein
MNWDQSPCFGASVLLFIDLLRWRDARRGRDSLAALMGAGINGDGRGHGIVPGRTDPLSTSITNLPAICTQRVEACFLLVAKPVIEFRERCDGHHKMVLSSPLFFG